VAGPCQHRLFLKVRPLDSVNYGTYDAGHMKKWALSIGILFLVIVSIPWSTLGHSDHYSAKDKPSILGKWDSVIRSNGSGLTLEFLSDGTFRENADFEKEGRYALKDDRLTTYVWDGKESREKQRVFDFRRDGDTITMKESDGTVEIQMKRVCKGGSAPADILGEWFSPNYPGAIPVFPADVPLRFPVFVEFTREKKIFFRSTPTKSMRGEYEVSDGTLLLKLPSESPLKSKPHVSSEQTDIRVSTKGPEVPFRRVTGPECATPLEASKQP
jgi:hypothetical protein